MRTCARIALSAVVVLAAWLAAELADVAVIRPPRVQADESVAKAALRRPVALLLVDDGRLLLAANRRGGSISVVDTASRRVVAERAVGKRLAGMAITPGGRYVLAVDEGAHELVLLRRRGTELARVGRLEVPQYPVTVRLSSDGKTCYVASLWSRRLSIIDVQPAKAGQPPRLSPRRTVDLPFAPRVCLLVQDDAKLIVADAFGGRLGIVDARRGVLEAVRQLPAHNIRGLALSADKQKLLVSHQILNDLAETTHNDVHWGVLMSNVLRWVVLPRVLDGQEPLLKGSHVHMTGDTQSAGADPAAVAVTRDGRAVVALGGVAEVGFGFERDYSLKRLPVGRRPTAVAVAADNRLAYVSNRFDDSISVVDMAQAKVAATIPLGPPAKLGLAERGEVLFYNARLSLDGWMSCHSCHTDGHTNGLLNDNLGDGSFGAPKRVLSLLGVGETGPWAWNGGVARLEDQIKKSIRTTMRGKEPGEEDVAAIAAYLKTFTPPPPVSSLRKADAAAIERGRKLFAGHECAACHRPPSYTSPGVFDVGLADKHGRRKFNPPSLRGVGQRGPFFHDNRAATLEDVFTRHGHQIRGKLKPAELRDLLAFLRSL